MGEVSLSLCPKPAPDLPAQIMSKERQIIAGGQGPVEEEGDPEGETDIDEGSLFTCWWLCQAFSALLSLSLTTASARVRGDGRGAWMPVLFGGLCTTQSSVLARMAGAPARLQVAAGPAEPLRLSAVGYVETPQGRVESGMDLPQKVSPTWVTAFPAWVCAPSSPTVGHSVCSQLLYSLLLMLCAKDTGHLTARQLKANLLKRRQHRW